MKRTAYVSRAALMAVLLTQNFPAFAMVRVVPKTVVPGTSTSVAGAAGAALSGSDIGGGTISLGQHHRLPSGAQVAVISEDGTVAEVPTGLAEASDISVAKPPFQAAPSQDGSDDITPSPFKGSRSENKAPGVQNGLRGLSESISAAEKDSGVDTGTTLDVFWSAAEKKDRGAPSFIALPDRDRTPVRHMSGLRLPMAQPAEKGSSVEPAQPAAKTAFRFPVPAERIVTGVSGIRAGYAPAAIGYYQVILRERKKIVAQLKGGLLGNSWTGNRGLDEDVRRALTNRLAQADRQIAAHEEQFPGINYYAASPEAQAFGFAQVRFGHTGRVEVGKTKARWNEIDSTREGYPYQEGIIISVHKTFFNRKTIAIVLRDDGKGLKRIQIPNAVIERPERGVLVSFRDGTTGRVFGSKENRLDDSFEIHVKMSDGYIRRMDPQMYLTLAKADPRS